MSASRLPRELLDIKRRLRALEVGPQLGYSSIEDGSIPTYDENGDLISVIGKQPDGSHTVRVVRAPKPGQPTDPTCTTAPMAIAVTWDGNLIHNGSVNTSQPLYTTDQACEVHVGDSAGFMFSPATYAGELPRAGGTVEVPALAGQKWVRLVIRAQNGDYGIPSVAVPVTVPSYVDPDDMDQLLVDLADAEQRVAEAKQRLDELDLTTLPQLDQKIDTAKGRLDSAFGLDTVFNVTQALEDSASATLTTAALDAQSKANAAKTAAEQAAAAHAELVASGAETAAIEAAEAYADARKAEAVSAAQAAATAAETAAKAHADTKAGAAETAAISAAQTYADQKKQEALTEAATTAQSKADAAAAAAQQAAEQYAALQASGASAAALEDAQEYADTKKQEAITAANQAASAAQAAAIAAAATDATQKAAAAETAAKNAAAADATAKADAAKTAAETAAKAHADLVAAGAEQAAIDAAEADAEAKALAAQQAAIAAAESYADAKKTEAINAAATTAQIKADAARDAAITTAGQQADSKVSTAVSPISTKLNTAFPGAAFNVATSITSAETAAKSHADTKASQAQTAAINAAAADATTKANTAKSDAISTAASDATTKANNAKAAAEQAAALYAELVAAGAEEAAIEAAALDAAAKASAAQTAAINAAAADATTKANTAKSDAISTAAADATSKANAAQTAAIAEAEDLAGGVEDRALSRGTDLITNGTGYLGTNYNFSFATVNSDAPPGAKVAFDRSGASTSVTDEVAPVDTSKIYQLAYKIRQRNPLLTGTRHYGMVVPVDADGHSITPTQYMYRPGTTTTLAQPLNPGDTVVHLTSAANWKNNAGSATHWRRIIFWNYVDGQGKLWPPETYSRWATGGDLWADGSVDYANNRITLKAPYSGPAYPAGHPVSNGGAGGSYMYLVNNRIVPPDRWDLISGLYGPGVHTQPETPGADPTSATSKLPPGTTGIRVGWLLTYQNAGVLPGETSTQSVAGVSFSDASAAQATADAAMLSADGKNAITYTDVAAPGPGSAPSTASGAGRRQFDVHRNRNASTGEVYAEWLWTGAAWVPVNFGDAILRSLDVGKISGGSAAFHDFVANNIVGNVATLIQLDASKIATGQLAAGRIDVANLAVSLANIIELNASRITGGTINVNRLNVVELAPLLSITADQITGGTINAVITMSGTFQTAASGARVLINSAGLRRYNAAGDIVLDATGNAVTMMGELKAHGATGSGVTIAPQTGSAYNSKGSIKFDTTDSATKSVAEIYYAAASGQPGWLRIQGPRGGSTYANYAFLDLIGLSNSNSRATLQASTIHINADGMGAGADIEFSAGYGAVKFLTPSVSIEDNGLLSTNRFQLGSDRLDTGWTSFTPVFKAGSYQPNWGNSTRAGAYQRIGKTVFFRAQVLFGSTFSAGSAGSYWSMDLPVPAKSGIQQLVQVHVVSTPVAGGEAHGGGKIEGTSTGVTRMYVEPYASSQGTYVVRGDSGWATGNRLMVMGFYEAD